MNAICPEVMRVAWQDPLDPGIECDLSPEPKLGGSLVGNTSLRFMCTLRMLWHWGSRPEH